MLNLNTCGIYIITHKIDNMQVTITCNKIQKTCVLFVNNIKKKKPKSNVTLFYLKQVYLHSISITWKK